LRSHRAEPRRGRTLRRLGVRRLRHGQAEYPFAGAELVWRYWTAARGCLRPGQQNPASRRSHPPLTTRDQTSWFHPLFGLRAADYRQHRSQPGFDSPLHAENGAPYWAPVPQIDPSVSNGNSNVPYYNGKTATRGSGELTYAFNIQRQIGTGMV